jgi:hypothetical protein
VLAALARLPAALRARASSELEQRLVALCSAAGSELLLAEGLASALAQQPGCDFVLLALQRAAAPVSYALARGVTALLERCAAPADGLAPPPPPAAVDACHAALGVLYALVQRHGGALSLHASGRDCLLRTAEACLASLLRPQPLSREGALTAAVVLVAAASLRLGTAECSAELARALFPGAAAVDALTASNDAEELVPCALMPPLGACLLDTLLPGGSLAARLRAPPPFARLCLLKALVAAAPHAALLHRLRSADGQPWSLMLQGVLPELCGVAEGTACSHERYHAISAATQCAQRLAAAGAAGALPAELRGRLEALAWGGWEDPQPQVVKCVHALFEALSGPMSGREIPAWKTHTKVSRLF